MSLLTEAERRPVSLAAVREEATVAGTPVAIGEGEGEALWFNRDLLVFKATSTQTGGAFILFEQTSQRGKTTPLHRHREDETFCVLEGEMIVHIDGTNHAARAGSVIFVPRMTPHAFLVTSGSLRTLILFTPGNESAEAWFRMAGDPAPAHELPEPGPPDVARLKAAAEQLDNPEILGPPPFAADLVTRAEPAAS
jgi:quercetin dioxygenase-like cupin family protein